MNRKTEIENWKQGLVSQARRASEQLVEQNMSIITEMKLAQRQLNEFINLAANSKGNTASRVGMSSV